MKTLSKEKSQELLSLEPTIFVEFRNQKGQIVTLFEHPICGEEFPVMAVIECIVCNTGFYDCDDMQFNSHHTEYTPVLDRKTGLIVAACDLNLA